MIASYDRFTKIGQMPLVESRDRHADGDLKNLVFFFVNGKILMEFINLTSRSIYFVMESKLAVASILEL